MLQMGATQGAAPVAHPFNAALEVDAGGVGTGPWIPYNYFTGIDRTESWVTNAPLAVRDWPGSAPAPSPFPSPPAFTSAQLTESPPAVYMKADPRSTRFGIFQINTNPTSSSRIMLPLWPGNNGTVPNGYGGIVGTDVGHVPQRFAADPYYAGTFSINAAPDGVRDTITTTYADNDGVIRPADAIYRDPTKTSTGSSTPYYTTTKDYEPIMLNRPFRSAAELGYVFRDLPWKTLDFFTDTSADAGLLDIFTINDGTPLYDSQTPPNIIGMAVPRMVAGSVNVNSAQTAVIQPVLAGAIWDDAITFSTVSNTGSPTVQNAQTMATNITGAASTTPFQNKAEIITRPGLPMPTILPTPTTSENKQTVKARREVVPRAISSVSQTRVWNLLIDVVAQSGRYAPGEANLSKFIVEGEQHYWVHVAIDRFTGEVIDKRIEVINE